MRSAERSAVRRSHRSTPTLRKGMVNVIHIFHCGHRDARLRELGKASAQTVATRNLHEQLVRANPDLHWKLEKKWTREIELQHMAFRPDRPGADSLSTIMDRGTRMKECEILRDDYLQKFRLYTVWGPKCLQKQQQNYRALPCPPPLMTELYETYKSTDCASRSGQLQLVLSEKATQCYYCVKAPVSN
ncbi:hypothetical protein F2P81_022032 [Scophthalmus maximus]|uniref:Uncharacterized protein n=1 Tax=Scophthalmus maximus TaxID=52904 RepID=A0A6A4S1U4_SCOMX|nr:hypothetical protein F2P81_022032 [Scophthalmus maximus]